MQVEKYNEFQKEDIHSRDVLNKLETMKGIVYGD
jgi:hypothetical protein